MIEINLLPPEHRPVERTPLPRLLTILVGILLSMAGLVIWCFLYFVKLPEQRNLVDEARKKEQDKRVQAEAVNKDKDTLKLYQKREEAMRQLYRDRIRWTRVLDRLAQARKDSARVVLTSLELKEAAKRGRGQGPAARTLVLKGYVPSFSKEVISGALNKDYLAFIAVLMEDKKWKEMFVDEEPLIRGTKTKEFSYSNVDEKLLATLPKAGLEFEVVFTFKSSEPPKPPVLVNPNPAPVKR